MLFLETHPHFQLSHPPSLNSVKFSNFNLKLTMKAVFIILTF